MSPDETDVRARAFSGRTALRCVAAAMCIGAMLAPGSAARTAAGPAWSFAAAKHYAIGNEPCSMAIGELNGDDKPDVVAGNCGSPRVSVLENRGDGTFEARRDYAVGHKPVHVDIADLNGDGKSDLLTANLDRTISVLLNQGAGTFGPPVTYPPGGLILVADLNGDDKPDLVTGRGISVMLNRGDGTFEPRRVYLSARDVDVALGDLNGDGKPELVIVNGYLPSDGRVSVLVNAGDGTFETRRDHDTGYPELVAIGDLNGDGKADVATADWQGGGSVLLNRGDGSLGPEREYECRSCDLEAEAHAIAIADVNGDGQADLVAEWAMPDPHDSNTFLIRGSVLLNKGLGSFSPARGYEIPYRSPLEIVDLNGDGKPDIAAPGEGLSVLLNRGAGRFELGLKYRVGGDALAIAS